MTANAVALEHQAGRGPHLVLELLRDSLEFDQVIRHHMDFGRYIHHLLA